MIYSSKKKIMSDFNDFTLRGLRVSDTYPFLVQIRNGSLFDGLGNPLTFQSLTGPQGPTGPVGPTGPQGVPGETENIEWFIVPPILDELTINNTFSRYYWDTANIGYDVINIADFDSTPGSIAYLLWTANVQNPQFNTPPGTTQIGVLRTNYNFGDPILSIFIKTPIGVPDLVIHHS